ncbi:MAG: class I SAM-dependent methyltransferase [Alphaproteobacteria bacterium]
MAGGDRVRAQYEAYPYPERDPADEARRLITGSPSDPDEISHYVFGGRLDTAKPFRVLVAGGGTGDGTIMLAQMLAWQNSPAEVVYLDLSEASLGITRARAAARGLDNLTFVQGSLLDLPTLDLGAFDYIDCCGVLHHLPDPGLGLATLAGVLASGGGMGLMVYGELGRIGVYHMQDVVRIMAGDTAGAERLDLGRRLLDDLPRSNWLRRNPYVTDHEDGGDAGLHDLFLHSQDRAYRVSEIAAMTASAGLDITGFVEPASYDPLNYLDDPGLRERAAGLLWIERCALAELLAGNLKRHVFYAVEAGRAKAALARPDGRHAVPLLRGTAGAEMAARLGAGGGRMAATLSGVRLSYDISAAGVEILSHVDGARNLGEIHALLSGDWTTFKAAFDDLYNALNALNHMLITYLPPGRADGPGGRQKSH